MRYSPAPDRPRTPVALLKTEGAPAPPNEWTPDSCQRGWAVKCARRARSQPDAPTNDWRRSSKPRARPRPVWRPRGREAFLPRESRLQDHPARQFPRIPVRPTSLSFPAVHDRSMGCLFRAALSCRCSKISPDSSRLRDPRIPAEYGLLEGGNTAGVAVAIYSMPVSVKAASVRNSWMQALILNQAPHRCRRKQSL